MKSEFFLKTHPRSSSQCLRVCEPMLSPPRAEQCKIDVGCHR